MKELNSCLMFVFNAIEMDCFYLKQQLLLIRFDLLKYIQIGEYHLNKCITV